MGVNASNTLQHARSGQMRSRIAALSAVAVSALVATSAMAQSQSGDPNNQQAIRMISSGQAGGGGKSFGGSFSMEGTIAQTIAAPMSGGAFLMRNGFIPMCQTDCELGDIDCDSSVNGSDLGILLLLFGDCPDPYSCPGDLDNNGAVDGGDIGLMLLLWH